MAVFETLAESRQAFKELMRVLKPGMLLMIGTIRKDSAWGKSYEKRIQEDPNTIYRFSVFKSLQEFEDLDREHLIKTGQCLFIPPDAPVEQFNQAEEERLSRTEAGGFMAGLWRKTSLIILILIWLQDITTYENGGLVGENLIFMSS